MASVAGANVPLVPNVILVAGGYISWFAVHYWRDKTQVYPSGPVKSLLTGKGLPAPSKTPSSGSQVANAFAPGATVSNVTPGTDNTSSTLNTSSGAANEVQFTSDQLGELWESVGGSTAQTSFAVGVAEAESSGNAHATSSNPDGGTNVGLWQLDTKGVGSGYSVEELKDPVTNAQITVMATRNGTDWSEWADPYVSAHGTHGNG